MSVLANQTNSTPGDAFFWRVNADTITAKTFVASSTIQTAALSTGTLLVGNISTSGSLNVEGNLNVAADITALNVTATDSLTTYFANTQYITSLQGGNIHGLLLANQIQGSNLVQFPNAILSSITTTSITLDGNTLDTAGAGLGAVLLLNGQPVATASTLTSSILTWSFYPAISTLQMSGNSIQGASVVQGDDAFFYDINAANQITFATNLYGETGNLTKLNAINISTTALVASNLSTVTLQATTLSNAGTLTSKQADITTINATDITTATLTTTAGGGVVAANGSFQNLTVSNSANFSGTRPNFTTGINSSGANNFNNQSLDNCPNINTQGTTSMTIASANGMDLTAPTRIQLICDGGSDVGSYKPVNIIGKNGNRGQVNLTAEPGYINVGSQIQGEVNITANGGGGLTAYATGGLVNITANTGSSPVLGTLSYSAIKLNAAGITSYAGFASPFVAVPGYNLIQGSLGIELVAGTIPVIPNVPGTVYLYGATGIPQQTGGVRCQNGIGVDFIVPYPQGFISPPYDLIISGNPAGQKVTLSNVRTLQSDGGVALGFNSMATSNLQTSNIVMFGNGANNGNILGLSGLEQLLNFSNVSSLNIRAGQGFFTTLVPQQVSTQSIFLSSINNLPFSAIIAPTIPSTFQELFTSSFIASNVQSRAVSTIGIDAYYINGLSSIDGYSIAQLVSSVSPPTPAPSTFLQLFTSSFVANTIQTSNLSTVGIDAYYLNGISSIDGYSIAQLVSSVSPPTPAPSTFNQLFTSSLVANTITGGTSVGLKLIGQGVTVQPSLDYSINLTTTGVGLTTIVTPVQFQVFSPSTVVYGDFRATTVNGQSYPPPPTSNYTQLFTSSLQANGISTATLTASQILLNGAALSPQVSSFNDLTTNTLAANQISSGSLLVSSISGYSLNQIINQPVVSTFVDLTTSTLNAYTGGILYQTGTTLQISSINGYNVQQFLSTPSPAIQVSTFNQLFTSSLAANVVVASGLSTTTLQTSSFNGYNISQLVNQQTISSFQQLYTSSLQALNISTGVLTASNISTQNINAFTLQGVSSINSYSIAQLVSSVSPQPPIPSTVNQFFTSSLAVNAITNYQGSDIDLTSAAYIRIHGGVGVNIDGDQCNVNINSANINLNSDQYIYQNAGQDWRATANVNAVLNSSNTLSIYNTNTAPPVASNDLYIIGQGNTTLAGQNNLNLSGVLDVNITGTTLYAQTSAVQFQVPTGSFAVNATNLPIVGTTRINLNTNSNINLFSLSSITTSAVSTVNTVPATWFSGDIRASTFNGAPLPTSGSATSTFTNLYVRQLSNNSALGNDLFIDAANAIRLNGYGNTTISLGESMDVIGATGAVNIQTGAFTSFNDTVSLTARSNITFTAPSTITSNVYVRSIYNNPGAGTDINITAAQTLGESAVSITRNASGTIVDDTVGGYTLNAGAGLATSITANNSITLSTITSINLNCLVPSSNVVVSPVQFATGQVFPQPGSGRYQFLTNNSAIIPWDYVLLTDSDANVYWNAPWDAAQTLNFPITATLGSGGYYDLKITYPTGDISEYLVQYELDGTLLYGIVTPTTADFTWGQGASGTIPPSGQINLKATEINLVGLSSINLSSPSLLWNGSPIGGGAVVSTFNTLYTSTISGNPLNYLSLIANRGIKQTALSTQTYAAGAWFSGDITATTFNGAPLPSGGGWVGTATSDLDMQSYKISGCNAGSSLGNFQPFKFIYEPPTAAGQSAEFAIQAHPQDAGVVFNLRYGVNLAGGYGYLLCEWPGYIVVPMKITGQDVELDGGETVHLKAGSGDVTIAATGGISLSNTTLTNGGRLTLDSDGQLNYAAQPSGYAIGSNAPIPLIQYGKVNLSIEENNTLIGGVYTIPIAYDDDTYNLQLTYNTNPPYAPDAGIVWSGQAYTSNTFQISAQGSNVGAGITLDFFWQTCGKYPKGAAV